MRYFYTLVLSVFCSFLLNSQNNTINYKALVKDNSGNPLVSQSIDIRFTIFSDASQIYQETHTVSTDANGIAIVNIGAGSTSDTFSDIDWNIGTTSLKTEIDSGSGFVDLGTTEFKSVPYALNSGNITRVVENGNIGFRLDFAPDITITGGLRGSIGLNAVDLTGIDDPAVNGSAGASGNYSFAANLDNLAFGRASFAANNGNTAAGDASAAFGSENSANGDASAVFGISNNANGSASLAFGTNSFVSGLNSISAGDSGNVSGSSSFGFGDRIQVSSNNALGIGEYNVDDFNAVFMVGNGSFGSRSNAITVLKNGKTTVQQNTTDFNDNAINGIKTHIGNSDSAGVYGENVISDGWGYGV